MINEDSINLDANQVAESKIQFYKLVLSNTLTTKKTVYLYDGHRFFCMMYPVFPYAQGWDIESFRTNLHIKNCKNMHIGIYTVVTLISNHSGRLIIKNPLQQTLSLNIPVFKTHP